MSDAPPNLLGHTVPAVAVRVGGLSKAELLSDLSQAGVRLNAAAEALFADARFTTSPESQLVQTAQVSVGSLGFPVGATFETLVERAAKNGLALCPLELGPHFRLQFRDQPEGFFGESATRHCAPPGSLTVASAPLAENEDEIPKGFYLRRIDGVLWLRGFYASPNHVYRPHDVFVFARDFNTA